MRQLRAVVVGYGNRGSVYCSYAEKCPEDFAVVGVVDTDPVKVRLAAERYHIPKERQFSAVGDFLNAPRFADIALICTQDRDHYAHAIPAMELGYDLLLEKPISDSLDECFEIAACANRLGRRVVVGHVLRYTVFFQEIKRLLGSGAIGKLVCIDQVENVGYWHYAHSYVRGNWRDSKTSSPMILAKCCHDLDLIAWLTGMRAQRVSSYGSLTYFKRENAPAGSAERCVGDCKVKNTCPFNAVEFYYKKKFLSGERGWPVDVLAPVPTEESVLKALASGPYGKCVFRTDNNVVDHQIVNMEFEDGVNASLTMSAFTKRNCRDIKLMGTAGEIVGNLEENVIRVLPFRGKAYDVDVSGMTDDFSFHSGGDHRLMKDLVDVIREGKASASLTTIDKSVESHVMALAAEQSRLANGKSVELDALYRVRQEGKK